MAKREVIECDGCGDTHGDGAVVVRRVITVTDPIDDKEMLTVEAYLCVNRCVDRLAETLNPATWPRRTRKPRGK